VTAARPSVERSLLLGRSPALLNQGLGSYAALDGVGFAVLRMRDLEMLESA
jgi:hypothetical protein